MSGLYTNVKVVKKHVGFVWPFCRFTVKDWAGFEIGTELEGYSPDVRLRKDGDAIFVAMGAEYGDAISLFLSTVCNNDVETFGEVYTTNLLEDKDIYLYQFPDLSTSAHGSLYLPPAKKVCAVLDAKPGEVYRVVWTNDATSTYYFVRDNNIDEVHENDLIRYLSFFENQPFMVFPGSNSDGFLLCKREWRKIC